MNDESLNNDVPLLPEFNRNFFNSSVYCSIIQGGEIGGKAAGLVKISKFLEKVIDGDTFPKIEISIPKFVVIGTDHFDSFMESNGLYETAFSNMPDERKILKFYQANLPAEILGDLRSIAGEFHTPLAVRSSSMLEDSLKEPFAGIYSTKMIPNNQPDVDERYRKLIEAVKYVYASTFFRSSMDYFSSTERRIETEKMAVIIQEVVGTLHNKRFYPVLSGVIKSHNFYPSGKSKPSDGIVNLSLGLGKTIVDGGVSWSYSPKKPKAPAPFGSPDEMAKNTQTRFWAINMNPLKEYNPTKESEYLLSLDLYDAEYDNSLKYISSTYDVSSNRILMGVDCKGPKVLDFAPLLKLNEFNFNGVINKLILETEKKFGLPVEIEFAMNIDDYMDKAYLGLLQARPMFVSDENIVIADEELDSEKTILRSLKVMGNGQRENIYDIIYVDYEKYDKKYNSIIAEELELLNRELLNEKKPYLLIGFGRWGSSDPWLGIPVNWGQISGSKVIVEATTEDMNVELSQGSHFFHNLSANNVFYFSLRHDIGDQINWNYIKRLEIVREKEYTKHVRLESPLIIKVDGKTCRGVIKYAE